MSSGGPSNNAPAVSTPEEKAVDKKEARSLPKMNRLPTLEDLARRIVPGATGTAESNATGPAEAPTPEAPGPRPRLSTSILSHRSQSRSTSTTNIDPSASESGSSLTTGSNPVLVAPNPGEEPPKDLAKDKIYRGYKNVPSLDAITKRMRARAGSSGEAPVLAAVVGVAKLSINAPPDSLTTAPAQPTPNSKSDTTSVSTLNDATLAQEETRHSSEEEKPAEPVDEDTHPLQFAWTLYHDSRGRFFSPAASSASAKSPSDDNQHYAAGLTVIGNFETVEDFCRYFNWLKPPSLLEAGSNYHVFKKGIQPMWEDTANANGGKWVITMKSNPELLDRCWSWLAMALVGEQIDERDEVCGAVVSVRHKIDRIQVWTRSKDNVDLLNSIGKKLYKLLDLGNEPSIGLEFQFHSDDRPSRNKFIHIVPRIGGGVEGATFPPAEGKGFSGGWRGTSSGAGGAFGSLGRGGAAGNIGKTTS